MNPYGPTPPRLTADRLRFEWRAMEDGRLPAPVGAIWRGAIGAALRGGSCLTGAATCEGCPFRSTDCAYGRLWETHVDDPGHPTSKADPASPYVIRPLSPGGDVRAGDVLMCEVRLFGAGRAHVAAMVQAAAVAAERGLGRDRLPLRLERVWRMEPDGRESLLSTVGVGRAPWIIEPDPVESGEEMWIEACSPLALKSRGRIIEGFDPVVFTLRLISRLGDLSRVHERRPVHWDVDGLRARAQAVRVVYDGMRPVAHMRHSRRSGPVPVRGAIGRARVVGVDAVLAGLWLCAPAVGVGKGTVMGLGAITIESHGEIGRAEREFPI